MSHTPGPWTADLNSRVVCERTGVVLASTYCPKAYDPKEREEKANGRLIAAAPELLQACRFAIRDADKSLNGAMSQTAYQLIKAAIAKAEGR